MSATPPFNPCAFCGFHVQTHLDRCPHCARPSLFPNVSAAISPLEIQTLELRYQEAITSAESAARSILQHFGTVVGNKSQAVLTRSAAEALRLATSGEELYASFHNLVEASMRLPSENFWGRVRGVVDEKLFAFYKDNIRFAALSLDQCGLRHYGDCSIVLKENMIAHRATVFEENSIMFLHRRSLPVTADMPAGYGAPWQKRGNLAVAKSASKINKRTTELDYPGILLKDGGKAEDDRFIEVHIYGSISIRTVEAMTLQRAPSSVRRKALQEKLAKYGIPLGTS